MGESDSGTRWYAVSTRSRQEKVAANTLQALGITYFLPLQLQKRQWSDRIQTINVPLFPGYLFVHVDPWSSRKLEVLKAPGITKFVGDRTGPLPIHSSEIEGIQSLVHCGVEFAPHPFLKEGDRVRVVRGALAGIEGILVRVGSRSRVVISIEIIYRSLAITVSEHDVEAVTAEPEKIREIA
ncbi:MAG TPA: UpxY family transcription antiterminator [Silvibacterium sp.]|nr:UpxY family transcription antiterminator [Silvibacterium sp.]